MDVHRLTESVPGHRFWRSKARRGTPRTFRPRSACSSSQILAEVLQADRSSANPPEQ